MKHKRALLLFLFVTAASYFWSVSASEGSIRQPRRLNNFVLEYADVEFQENDRSFTLELDHPEWLYISLSFEGRAAVILTGADGTVTALEDPGETMRYLPAGDVAIRVLTERSAQPRRLIVRRVPEIMVFRYEEHQEGDAYYNPGVNIKHTWEDFEKSVLHSANVIASRDRDFHAPYAQKWQRRGGRWLVKGDFRFLRDENIDPADYFYGRLADFVWDGLILDEIGQKDTKHYERWADGLARFSAMPGAEGKSVYFFYGMGAFAHPSFFPFELTDETVVHGSRSVLCLPHGDNTVRTRQLGVKLEPGVEYTFSAYMRTEDVVSSGYTGLFIIDDGWINEYGMLSPVESSSWKRYERTFTPRPSSGGAWQILLTGPKSGKMWVDAVKLERGPRATEFSSGDTNLLSNPDFEDGLSFWMTGAEEKDIFYNAAIDHGHYFAPEIYLFELPTEEAALSYVNRRLVHDIALWAETDGLLRSVIATLLKWDLRPSRWSLDRFPDVNSKVFLEMQLRALATGDGIEDLAGVGFWTAHYGSPEMLRWYGALFRHYCIEGNTEPLSTDPYILSHIMNPDFSEGLQGWDVSGSVDAVKLSDMPEGGPEVPCSVPSGDMVIRTIRKEGGSSNSFGQPIRGLEPGRLYSLRLYSTDSNYSNRAVPADITIEGGDIRSAGEDTLHFTEGKWSHVWRGSRAFTNVHWTMHFRIFRATGTEGYLKISDVEPGEVYWDFIKIEPFFEYN